MFQRLFYLSTFILLTINNDALSMKKRDIEIHIIPKDRFDL